jgi:hypothetical protein
LVGRIWGYSLSKFNFDDEFGLYWPLKSG